MTDIPTTIGSSEPAIAGQTARLGHLGKGHPISVFTWIGGKSAKLDQWDNQGRLQQCPGDTEEAHIFPTAESLDRLAECTVSYIHNHGGVLTTGIQAGRVDIRVAGLGFPKEEHRGPSVILFMGCGTGRARYAEGLGILPESRTKAYIGCDFEPTMAGLGADAFQEAFFAAFGSGVSVEEACRKGYEAIKRSENPVPFEEMFTILGNRRLTLGDVRRSLDQRDAFHHKQQEASGSHLCGAVCKDFEEHGFCDHRVRAPGQHCWQH